MEPMDALKKPGIMAKLRNRKGFSLVEMAIVLVIIGIIIAAIVKGQDLILNSRAKQLISAVSSWRNLAMAYLDRNGRLPGDIGAAGVGPDGLIGNTAATEQVTAATATAEIVNSMSQAPNNPIVIGSQSFWVYFGNVPATIGRRNAIVVCKDALCATALDADDIEFMKALDTAIDGSADGGTGQVRAISAALVAATDIIITPGAVNGRTNYVIASATTPVITPAGTPLVWGSATQYGAIWTFDKVY